MQCVDAEGQYSMSIFAFMIVVFTLHCSLLYVAF